jgi:hypothetical protein
MTAMQALPKDSPIMVAWEKYKSSDEYANSRKWAASEKYVDGSMWAAFLAGYQASAPSQPAPVVAESVNSKLLREATLLLQNVEDGFRMNTVEFPPWLRDCRKRIEAIIGRASARC